jgi:haloalkane dehalogenase
MMYQKKMQKIREIDMAYLDEGAGDTILLLHGNPSSSYIWRNVIAGLRDRGRCLAPDLLGMGDSGKLDSSGPDSYRFVEHREYLDELLASLDIGDDVVVVGQDWGSALGFDWANRNRDRVKGIVHTESIVRPWGRNRFPMTDELEESFLALRSAAGDHLILEQNVFVEHTVADGIIRTLSPEEMNEYRRPFLEAGESRRPTLTWPREIPYDGEPADVHDIVTSYSEWLRCTEIPKLFINAEPGYIVDDDTRTFIRGWNNQEEVTIVGRHFVQEDAPAEIATAIASWLGDLSAE